MNRDLNIHSHAQSVMSGARIESCLFFSSANACNKKMCSENEENGENGNVSASDVCRSLDTEHLVFIKS